MQAFFAVDPNQKQYYFGRISRDEAQNILTKAGKTDGLFLLRQNLKITGHYVISICFDSQISHYKLDRSPNHNVKLDKSGEFPGPIELVSYLKRNDAGLCTRLKQKCYRRHNCVPVGYLFVENSEFKEAVEGKMGHKREQVNNSRIRYSYERLVLADLHQTQNWFRKNTSSRDAEELFQENGLENGKFMLRSTNVLTRILPKYKLSVCFEKKVYHHDIEFQARKYFLENDCNEKFEFLTQLIDFYGRTKGPLEHKLTKPFYIPTDAVYVCDSNENYKICTLDEHVDDDLTPIVQVISCIAFGPISNVYHVFYKENPDSEGQHLALKFLNHFNIEQGLINETEILREVSPHPNIIQSVDIVQDCNVLIRSFHQDRNEARLLRAGFNQGNILRIINNFDTRYTDRVRQFTFSAMEYSHLGHLNKYIRDRQETQNTQIFQYLRQVLNALEFVASRNIVHRHVTARNVLLFDDKLVKLSGFGLARRAGVIARGNREGWPVQWYPPEAFDNNFSEKTDVWSFGVMLWEAFERGVAPYHERPFATRDDVKSFIKGIQSGSIQRLPKPVKCTDRVYELMELCWSRDVNARPVFTEISKEFDAIFQEYIIYDEEHF